MYIYLYECVWLHVLTSNWFSGLGFTLADPGILKVCPLIRLICTRRRCMASHDLCVDLLLLHHYSRPRVEWYKSLRALTTSPPWNCFALLRSRCSRIESCFEADSVSTPDGWLITDSPGANPARLSQPRGAHPV